MSINTNQYQPIPTKTNQSQPIPNQYQINTKSIPTNTNQYQSIPNNTKQYQTIPNNTNQYLDRCVDGSNGVDGRLFNDTFLRLVAATRPEVSLGSRKKSKDVRT
jgi:hypothetical protein